jgi:hypothetical protein
MKKRIFAMAVIGFAAITLTAQERDRDRIQDQDQTKLMVVNGQMLQLRDRAELHLQEKQTLSDGTVLEANGKYISPEGNKYRLKNGECLDGDGALYRNEYQYRNKVQRENEGLNREQVRERNQNRIFYTMVDGEVLLVRNQEQNRLEQAIRLEDGTMAYPDGSYQLQNREREKLQNGAILSQKGPIYRNMYQFRKQLIRPDMPAKGKMIKHGQPKPKIQTRKKSS